MGASVSSAVKGAMEAQQEEMKRSQMAMQERMRRMQMAQMMAMKRDLVQWMAAAWTVAVGGATIAKLRGHRLPPVAAVPFTIFSTVLLYQADAAYGTKMERVNAEFDRIVNHEEHWFVPIDPPKKSD